MEKFINKFWAIVWTGMCVLGIVAIFWNPAHWLTVGASALMAILFWEDYIKTKNENV